VWFNQVSLGCRSLLEGSGGLFRRIHHWIGGILCFKQYRNRKHPFNQAWCKTWYASLSADYLSFHFFTYLLLMRLIKFFKMHYILNIFFCYFCYSPHAMHREMLCCFKWMRLLAPLPECKHALFSTAKLMIHGPLELASSLPAIIDEWEAKTRNCSVGTVEGRLQARWFHVFFKWVASHYLNHGWSWCVDKRGKCNMGNCR